MFSDQSIVILPVYDPSIYNFFNFHSVILFCMSIVLVGYILICFTKEHIKRYNISRFPEFNELSLKTYKVEEYCAFLKQRNSNLPLPFIALRVFETLILIVLSIVSCCLLFFFTEYFIFNTTKATEDEYKKIEIAQAIAIQQNNPNRERFLSLINNCSKDNVITKYEYMLIAKEFNKSYFIVISDDH